MKKIIGILAIVFFSVTTSCQDSKQAETKDGSQTEINNEQAKYACAMKCEGDKTYDKAGTCPECGMDLVAVEKLDNTEMKHDDGHDHGTE